MVKYNTDTGIFVGDHNYKFDESLAQSIVDLYKNEVNTVCDLGCGIGKYTKFFSKYFNTVHGYEGNITAIKNKVYDKLYYADLTKHYNYTKYDLCVCLEVGEHIPNEYESIFIHNLYNFTGKHLVLSWAVRGQNGKGHVNCLDNNEVIDKLSKIGFDYRDEKTHKLRNHCTLKWFKNTIMVFGKKG